MKNEDKEKVNILLVDDHQENLLTLEAIIENENYNLMKATSGEEALKYLMKHDFAVILLDVQMPGMDGFTTAKIIKAREKTKNIPILFITANNMETEHIFLGYSIGAIDYILKPFDPFILKTKVEGFVELYQLKQKLIKQAEELKERNKVIEYMAYHDSLTNLPNRRMFQLELVKRLNHAREFHETLVCLFLDLDRFKNVNDSLGYVIGDKLLQSVANILSDFLDKKDFIARVGGDKFNIILSNLDREEALEVAEKILELFKNPFYVYSYEIFVTVSMGLSIFPYDGENSNDLIKNADAALFHAKEQGQNQYKVYYSGMNILSYRTYLMEKDFRKSLQKNELVVYYQPIVNINTGIVTKAEALLRWKHSNWGTLTPNQFLPIAEQTGLISDMGEWVLKQVCEQIYRWNEQGLKSIPITINFSAQQFMQKNFVFRIEELLKNYNISPRLIEIDVKETVLLENEKIILETLQKLKKMQIKINLDDFGTGYSSLRLLRTCPIDTIKLDRSVIQEITQKNQAFIIADTICTLAKNLNINVIAEGVETRNELEVLAKLHCEEYQGFVYSPPLPPEKFITYLLPEGEKTSGYNDDPLLSQEDSTNHEEKLNKVLITFGEKYTLSTREIDVLKLIINGLTNREISKQLFISEHTVKNHITRIFQKLGVNDRVQAIGLVFETSFNQGEKFFNDLSVK